MSIENAQQVGTAKKDVGRLLMAKIKQLCFKYKHIDFYAMNTQEVFSLSLNN